jgi:hypothetical protein
VSVEGLIAQIEIEGATLEALRHPMDTVEGLTAWLEAAERVADWLDAQAELNSRIYSTKSIDEDAYSIPLQT